MQTAVHQLLLHEKRLILHYYWENDRYYTAAGTGNQLYGLITLGPQYSNTSRGLFQHEAYLWIHTRSCLDLTTNKSVLVAVYLRGRELIDKRVKWNKFWFWNNMGIEN